MKKQLILATLLTATITLPVGWLWGHYFDWTTFMDSSSSLKSPFVAQLKPAPELPLLKYSLINMQTYPYQGSQITVNEQISSSADFDSYLFSYQTLNKTMTGQLNIPTTPAPKTGYPVVIMIRGWVPEETYVTGTGTKSAAAVLAKNGYVTLAPDFFGYGDSDPEVLDTWEARFQKPINIVELIKTIQLNPLLSINDQVVELNPNHEEMHIWAHSNGGQISLAALEISGLPIKTSLWAPVTAPFPYSILFFSDEHQDEGKKMRKWLSLFEDEYDVFEFSITQHLDQLRAPLQIHQGTSDDAVPVSWNDEFIEKIELENKRRLESTDSAKLAPIEINYFRYPGANHNLQPNWNQAIHRDLVFFK